MENQKVEKQLVHVPKNGQWTLVDDKVMWREIVGKKPNHKFEYFTPEQIGLKKSVNFSIVTSKEILTHETLTATGIVYFVQHVKVSVRPDQEDVWLLEENGKVFMKNLRLQTTGICDLRSNPWVLVTKTEFIRTTLKKIKELEKKRIVLAFNKYDPATDTYGLFTPI